MEEPVLKIWGNTALTAGRLHLEWTQDGRRQSRLLRIAHVWAKDDGHWRTDVHATHARCLDSPAAWPRVSRVRWNRAPVPRLRASLPTAAHDLLMQLIHAGHELPSRAAGHRRRSYKSGSVRTTPRRARSSLMAGRYARSSSNNPAWRRRAVARQACSGSPASPREYPRTSRTRTAPRWHETPIRSAAAALG